MTELTIEIAAIVGAAAGGTMGLLMSWAAWMYDRRPYSSAAITFRATAEDAAKVRLETADVIRYLRRRDEQTMRALTDPYLGTPWDKPRD